MGYRLRSGLSKMAVYDIVREYIPADIQMPSVRKCDFRKFRASYWMDFQSLNGNYFQCAFMTCGGVSSVSLEQVGWPEGSDSLQTLDSMVIDVPFQYLQEHGYLREVA